MTLAWHTLTCGMCFLRGNGSRSHAVLAVCMHAHTLHGHLLVAVVRCCWCNLVAGWCHRAWAAHTSATEAALEAVHAWRGDYQLLRSFRAWRRVASDRRLEVGSRAGTHTPQAAVMACRDPDPRHQLDQCLHGSNC
jgi:hypothetical protein